MSAGLFTSNVSTASFTSKTKLNNNYCDYQESLNISTAYAQIQLMKMFHLSGCVEVQCSGYHSVTAHASYVDDMTIVNSGFSHQLDRFSDAHSQSYIQYKTVLNEKAFQSNDQPHSFQRVRGGPSEQV